jgi:thioredoxin-related protein
MIKLKLVTVSILSLSLLIGEELYEVIEDVPNMIYEEIGVISEPTILESTNMNEIDVIKFESEIKKEQEAPQIVEPMVDSKVIENIEQNLSTEESINPIFTTFDKALKIAKEENKIVLLTVVANNCKFCKKMEDEVLSIDGVQEAIKKDFILALVNEDKEPLPLGLSPQMTPMFVFISKNESVEDMRFGYIKEKKFLELLATEKSKIN